MKLLTLLLLFTQPPSSFPPAPGLVHPLRYGDKVKESIITDRMDKEGSRIALIEFFNPKKNPRYYAYHLSYTDALYERYKGKGLLVVAISGNDSISLDSFKRKYRLHLPFIFDKDWNLHREFGVPAGYTRTFMVDKDRKILFSYPSFPPNDQLHRIIEKYIPEISEETPFKIGQRLPDIHLTNEKDEEVSLSQFYGSPLIVTIISPATLRCGACRCSERLRTLNKIAKEEHRVKVIVIFNYPFEGEKLAKFRRDRHLSYPIFSTFDFARILLPLPLTMVIDKNGNISLIEYADKGEEEIKEEILNRIRRMK